VQTGSSKLLRATEERYAFIACFKPCARVIHALIFKASDCLVAGKRTGVVIVDAFGSVVMKGTRGVTIKLLDFAFVLYCDISDIVVHSPSAMMVVVKCVGRAC
jgi:hypothetical protein